MIRNLKVLGLALVVVLSMGIAASSASVAAEFHTESAPTTLTGSQETTNTFTTDSGTFHCSSVTFTGTVSVTTTTAIEVTPAYSGCQSTGFIKANITVDTNGCKTTYTAHGTTEDAVHTTGCDAGKPGLVTTAPFCTITITPQTKGQVHYETFGVGATHELVINHTIQNVTYHESGFACKNSGASNTTGGTYSGKVRYTAENGVGAHVGFTHTG